MSLWRYFWKIFYLLEDLYLYTEHFNMYTPLKSVERNDSDPTCCVIFVHSVFAWMKKTNVLVSINSRICIHNFFKYTVVILAPISHGASWKSRLFWNQRNVMDARLTRHKFKECLSTKHVLGHLSSEAKVKLEANWDLYALIVGFVTVSVKSNGIMSRSL